MVLVQRYFYGGGSVLSLLNAPLSPPGCILYGGSSRRSPPQKNAVRIYIKILLGQFSTQVYGFTDAETSQVKFRWETMLVGANLYILCGGLLFGVVSPGGLFRRGYRTGTRPRTDCSPPPRPLQWQLF